MILHAGLWQLFPIIRSTISKKLQEQTEISANCNPGRKILPIDLFLDFEHRERKLGLALKVPIQHVSIQIENTIVLNFLSGQFQYVNVKYRYDFSFSPKPTDCFNLLLKNQSQNTKVTKSWI